MDKLERVYGSGQSKESTIVAVVNFHDDIRMYVEHSDVEGLHVERREFGAICRNVSTRRSVKASASKLN